MNKKVITSLLFGACLMALPGYADAARPVRSAQRASESGATLPYKQMFDDESTFSAITVIDANQDGTTWKMSAANGYASVKYADDGGNDWLVLPQMKLSVGRMYKFACKITTPYAPNWPERVGVYYGSEATASALTNAIQKDSLLRTNDAAHEYERYFTVAQDGNYFIGIHSGGNQFSVIADSIFVEEGPIFAAPDSVTALKAAFDATGALKATVSFTTPTKTVAGDALQAITKVEVYRGESLIKTFESAAVGESLSYTDTEATAGFNTYRVVAYNAVGFGYNNYVRVYVGEDVPSAPTNVRVTASDGVAKITWTAPTVGQNGGYVDTPNLYYGIQDNSNNVITYEAKGTSYNASFDDSGEQAYLMYAVFAGNQKGYSTGAASNSIIKGTPYQLPFSETFPASGKTYFWGINIPETSYSTWAISGGSASYSGSYRAGDEATLYSGKIDVRKVAEPVLEFDYWYRANSGDMPLEVRIISEGKDTTTVKSIAFTNYSQAKDFEQVRVPLSDYKTKKFIQVAYYIKTGDSYTRAAIDNVRVRDYYGYDLKVSAEAPDTATAGDEISVKATVENIGSKVAGGYKVNLYEAGKVIATQDGTDLQPDAKKTFTFKVPVTTLKPSLTFKVVADFASDADNSNNTSDEMTTPVALPVHPTPTDLTAAAEGSGVKLGWTAPDYTDYTVPTIDGAEDYESFIIDSIGGWTTVDKDSLATRASMRVDTYPVTYTHQGEKMAFIVMDPTKAGAPYWNYFYDAASGWQPNNGDKYFASFGSTEGANDDWLISPELDGRAQTISFSVHGYGSEKYEVLYSTTDRNTDSFTSVASEKAVATVWTKASFNLPAGAKYFAIRNISAKRAYYLFIDDITFNAASKRGILTLSGYNVYRDGEKLNTELLPATSFTDAKAAEGTHTYQVTAVYNLGESASASCEYEVASGIVTAAADGTLRVISSYDLSGKPASGSQKGIVIQKMSDGTVRKVLVK